MSKLLYSEINSILKTAKMNSERISLTCAPGGENHRGNQLIGRMPIKGEGFKADDIEKLANLWRGETKTEIEVLNLNQLSNVDEIMDLGEEHQARVMILRNFVSREETEQIYSEIAVDSWDSKYLDPNKYRTEIIDGKEVRLRGKVLNKHARQNLCYVPGMTQKPEYLEGKGTIIDLKSKSKLNEVISRLRTMIDTGLLEIGSDTRVEINVVEGNRYFNLKKTGIGYHGDTERVVVICVTIGGGGNYPMRWQWFKKNALQGENMGVSLNDGDVYIMSEKAVGADWKSSSIYTLRHAAGCNKYISVDKWIKRAAAKKEKKNAQKKLVVQKKPKKSLKFYSED